MTPPRAQPGLPRERPPAGAHPARRGADHFTIMIKIPDTLEGAILLSLIDLFLSFVIISGIGVILAALPVVNRWWKIDEAKLRRGGH